MPTRTPLPTSAQLPYIYVGIKGSVVALRKDTGEVVWSTKLKRGSEFVPLVVEGGRVYAVSGGEISCLDPLGGDLVWHNRLKGFGMGYALLAGASSAGVAAVATLAAAAAAASAAAASAAAAG